MRKRDPRHTSCLPGTRVRLRFKDGSIVEDVFLERTRGTTLVFERLGRVRKRSLASFTVLNPRRLRP